MGKVPVPPQATPSVRRCWAHTTGLGAWRASLWGLVPGAAPGGDRCSFPGKWKGLLESPILPVAGSGPHRCQDPCVGQGGSGLWNVKHRWVHSLKQRSLVQALPERDARILRALDFGGRTTRKVYHQSPPSRDNSMPLAQGHSLASWLQKLSRKWTECPTPGFHVCGHSLSWGPTDLERGLPVSPLHTRPARQETWPSQGPSTAA